MEKNNIIPNKKNNKQKRDSEMSFIYQYYIVTWSYLVQDKTQKHTLSTHAHVRAKPGQTHTPVIAHLVWQKRPHDDNALYRYA